MVMFHVKHILIALTLIVGASAPFCPTQTAQAGQVLCCCQTQFGQCCKWQGGCFGFVSGCFCRP